MTPKTKLLFLGSAKALTRSVERGSVQEPIVMVLYLPGT